ncbi:substrate-binding periplasmic protein [Vitreoscilla filiformis]|jgi:polar amino acid transport system substrate-binding protein|uniref:substrate-binding periplasmic protein n=1 Tax=Vitreoscilla filiformis TaxID=63 RepID=UPI000B7A3691|nr:transporter substrate-binding domain-containing protein [Vitreoscilla filiformis]
MPSARLDKRTFLLASFWGVSLSVCARHVLTISTNNTPSDRKALEQLAAEAFRRVGFGIQVVNNPSERSLVLANQGEVDGEGLRVAGLATQYPHLIQVPERFIGISFVAFVRQPGLQLDGWASLQPHRIGFITGWKMFEAHATGARIVNRVDTPEQLFRMLAQDRIDVALYTLADGLALVQRLGLSGIQAVTPSLRDVDMFLYLHQRHSALVPQVAQALRDMKADGSHARLLHGI